MKEKGEEIVAIVTGANKGLGFALVNILSQNHRNWRIYLTARDAQRGNSAVDSLAMQNVIFHQLDIDNLQSVQRFKSHLEQKHPNGISLLINNAGVMPNVRLNATDNNYQFDKDGVRSTVTTNYFGTLNVLNEFFPLMSDENGTVINISSRLARSFYRKCSEGVQQRFENTKTVEDLSKIANDFLEDLERKNLDGWFNVNPATALHMSYRIGDLLPIGFTHSAIAVLTEIFQERNKKVAVNSACPGSIKTDMNPTGVYSPEQGADSILYLASRLDQQPWDDKVANLRRHFVADRQCFADWRQAPSDIAEDTS